MKFRTGDVTLFVERIDTASWSNWRETIKLVDALHSEEREAHSEIPANTARRSVST